MQIGTLVIHINDDYEEMLGAMSATQAANTTRFRTELVEAVKEELSEKFGFHRIITHSAIGMFAGEIVGGSLEFAVRRAGETCDEHDALIAAGLKDKVLRV